MESKCSEGILSASSDEAEYQLYPKRIKIESSEKRVEKEEQQKLEQSTHGVNRYQTSPHEPMYLSGRQNSWSLDKQSYDTAGKTCMREFFYFQTCHREGLPCRLSENKLAIKKRSPEKENQMTVEDDISLTVHDWPLETEAQDAWGAANTWKHLLFLNSHRAEQNDSTEQNRRRDCENDLRHSSSVAPSKRDLFQMELLSRKSVSDNRWKQYQLLQIPFLCGTSSVLSHTGHEKNIFQKEVCTAGDKGYSRSDNETTAERDSAEKNNSSYVLPTLKPFRRIQPLEIPNFQFPGISNKINNEMPSSNLKEMDRKNFKGQPFLMESKQKYCVQKMSETGKQNMQNDKIIVKASMVGSESKEKNYQPVSKQEHSPLAEGGKGPVTSFRGNSTAIECSKIFAKNNFRDKMLENSDGDNDQKSRFHIFISAKNIQNEKFTCSNDLLKRLGRRSSNENAGTFHIQTSLPVIEEELEKNELFIQCNGHNSNSGISLCEAPSKLFTKEILDLTKNVIFESNCPYFTVQNFPDTKVIFSIFREGEKFTLKFSFQNLLFGRVGPWIESLCGDMSLCQDDRITDWFPFPEALREQRDTQQFVKSHVKRSHIREIHVRSPAVSKHLKVEQLLETILASFCSRGKTLLPIEGKSVYVEKAPSCGRKQVQSNSCSDETWRQNTGFQGKKTTYPGFVNPTVVESIVFRLYNEYQRSPVSKLLESTFLKKGALFHNQKSGLCKGRHVRKHHFLPRGSEVFNTYLRSVSHKNGMKKQRLVAKCPILLQATFGCSSLEEVYRCRTTKMQDVTGSWSYSPAHSQLKFEKIKSKYTNQGRAVAAVKQEKKTPTKIFDSCFHRERFKGFPVGGNKNQETTGCGNSVKSARKVTNEVTYSMEKYSGTSGHINTDRKELQINYHNFFPNNSFSIFDTYEKIPLTTDSEDFEQISVANQDGCVIKKLSEEKAVTSSKEANNSPSKSSHVFILPESSKATKEKNNSLLLQESQGNEPETCSKPGTYNPHLANKPSKSEDQNTYLHSGKVFPGSSGVYQPVTLPLDRSSFADTGGAVPEGEGCRSSPSADKQKQSDQIPAAAQVLSAGSSTVADTYLRLEATETGRFSFQRPAQPNQAISSEPVDLKESIEYVKAQEISEEQMHVTNESQCETLMNDLIMSYSEDEPKTVIAAEEKLKMHLSAMNNGCLEDVKDKYLPLENKITYEIELKRKFDLVLEELHLFHEISKGNENNSSSLATNPHNCCELNNSEGLDENVTSASQKEIHISYPICGSIEEQSISNEISFNEKLSNENEDQEVPMEYCIPRVSGDELLQPPLAQGYFDAACKKPYAWDPAFLPCTLLKEQCYHLQKEGGHFLSREVIRVQPLKTCKGPIRIGLSRKARPRQLHPYLK